MNKLKQQIEKCLRTEHKALYHWYYFIVKSICGTISIINIMILNKIYGVPYDELIEWVETIDEDLPIY